jgi:Carbohydrate esterase, sialic acid-specific acetylesterase
MHFSESDWMRRTARLGAVTLAIVGAFLAGAGVGVVRPWPVRHPLQLIEGRPKPIAAAAESQPLAVDRAGRLLRYPGKIEVQCPAQSARTAVILIAGQSNAANSGAQRHSTRYPDRVLNFIGGGCFVAGSPLLGSNGFAGEFWTLVGDRLIGSGAFDKVILASVAVGGSRVEQWAQGGGLNATMNPLVDDLTSHYRVTHVLWLQGESDYALRTDPGRYKEQFLSFVASLRADGVAAPVYISEATRCGPGWTDPNPIRTAQRELATSQPGLEPGVDTDTLVGSHDRYDACHFADSGEIKAARAWAAILAPRSRLAAAAGGGAHPRP